MTEKFDEEDKAGLDAVKEMVLNSLKKVAAGLPEDAKAHLKLSTTPIGVEEMNEQTKAFVEKFLTLVETEKAKPGAVGLTCERVLVSLLMSVNQGPQRATALSALLISIAQATDGAKALRQDAPKAGHRAHLLAHSITSMMYMFDTDERVNALTAVLASEVALTGRGGDVLAPYKNIETVASALKGTFTGMMDDITKFDERKEREAKEAKDKKGKDNDH